MTDYNRRKFIRHTLLAGTTTLLSTCSAGFRPGRSPAPQDTILVIGAGIAGLAAARKLHHQGYAVTVLEGRNRIGGRIWTDTSLGSPLDLGASWIHGIEGNPITQLAQQFKVKTRSTDFAARVLYDQAGTKLTTAELQAIDREYDMLSQAFDRFKTAPDTTTATSLADVVERTLAERKLSGRRLRGVNWQLASYIEIDNGANLAELALLPYQEDDEFEGDDVVFPQGYIQIARGLAQGLNIQLNQIVRRIELTEQGVKVTTNQGEFTGARGIVTLPLGVLKQGSIQFSPALPQEKVAAIQRLAMGTLNKIALRFPSQFWPEASHSLGYLQEKRDRNMEYWNWHRYNDHPILVAMAGGAYARSFGRIPSRQLVAQVMAELRTIFGQQIPDPVKTMITHWHQDPFALGSYSHCPPGSDLGDCDLLAKPVGDRLFFAGEATSSRYPATVHGAFLSGEREADRILADDEK